MIPEVGSAADNEHGEEFEFVDHQAKICVLVKYRGSKDTSVD